jgi:hypothetical protein
LADRSPLETCQVWAGVRRPGTSSPNRRRGGVSSPEGEIGPGERLRGSVGSQVPADATGLMFVFDGDVFGVGKVFVALPAQ